MKVAIHKREGSFSDEWIKYCIDNNVNYKIVNAYSSSIIKDVADCDIFMWHHHHNNFIDVLCAKKILFAIEQSGKKVYPDFNTGWHFDDKVAQMYLFEAINAPLVPSFIFYNKEEALKWASTTDYPKVFKLKGGAGAKNVLLVESKKDCFKIINKAFSKGFSQYNVFNAIKDDLLNFKKKKEFVYLIKALSRFFRKPEFANLAPRERGYVYFQNFIAGNTGDIRLIVINGQYVYGMKRMNREGDFRASGSGEFNYDNIPISAVEIAFNTAKRLKLQSIAFDFVLLNETPLLVEMSYGFGTKGSSKCNGFWTDDLKFHEGKFNPIYWILEKTI